MSIAKIELHLVGRPRSVHRKTMAWPAQSGFTADDVELPSGLLGSEFTSAIGEDSFVHRQYNKARALQWLPLSALVMRP